jgi:hypothetical protein
MHGINAEFATAVRGMCTDFQNRCAEFRKFPRGFCLALIPLQLPINGYFHSVSCINWCPLQCGVLESNCRRVTAHSIMLPVKVGKQRS